MCPPSAPPFLSVRSQNVSFMRTANFSLAWTVPGPSPSTGWMMTTVTATTAQTNPVCIKCMCSCSSSDWHRPAQGNPDQLLLFAWYYFLCRNCGVSQWQLPLHQRRFPPHVHPFLSCQRWNLRYNSQWVFLSLMFAFEAGFFFLTYIFQYPDCCDTTDEYNSGAVCQNTCR